MHLTDADLIRHLDGEGQTANRQAWTEHMEGCVICTHRFRDMERTSQTFSTLLRTAAFEDTPAPDGAFPTRDVGWPRTSAGAGASRRPGGWRRVASSPWLRAAMIVLLVAAPLTAVPPVREWVLSRVSLVAPQPPAATAPTARTAPAAPAIRFQPAPGVFTLRVDAQPAGSTLTLGVSPSGDAILESAPGNGREGGSGADGPAGTQTATSGGAIPAPVVSESMLRLPSAEAPVAYELRVPSTVTAVRLVRDGSTVELDTRSLEAGVTLTF